MQISKQFQGKFFGDFIDDIYKNYAEFKIPSYKWEDGSPVVIQKYRDYHNEDDLRKLLKIFDEDFPKHENGIPWSMANVRQELVLKHIDYIRLVLINNGSALASDEAEWQRTIEMYNR